MLNITSTLEFVKAIEITSNEGIPYQAFITSILHKASTGKVVSYAA